MAIQSIAKPPNWIASALSPIAERSYFGRFDGRALDRAVQKLYGFPVKGFTEADCVAALMERYQKLTGTP